VSIGASFSAATPQIPAEPGCERDGATVAIKELTTRA